MILSAEGQPKTPSVVLFPEPDGSEGVLVGQPVEELLLDVSTDRALREDLFGRTVAGIKRNLLSPPRIALPGGRYVRPVEVAAEVLGKLKRDAEEGHFHEPVRRAVITCPAEFNTLQRKKIEEAGLLAGFSEVALLEEPVAGALAYARAGLNVGRRVLVYDLGGGTFDLAVLDGEDDSFHVAMEPRGMERCGGEDFDLALYHHCDGVAREGLGRPISLTSDLDLNFLRACRRRKESLTFQERGRFNQYLASTNGPVHFEHEVERETFEELIGEYVETTARLTEEILARADSAGGAVENVVLIGGSVRVPLVGRTLRKTLPVEPLGFDKRDVAVALGAAHYADVLWGGKRSGSSLRRTGAYPTGEPSPEKQYESALQALGERDLDRVETDRLADLARRLGLSGEEAAALERRALGETLAESLLGRYRRALGAVRAAGGPGPLEVEWLASVAEDLGLDGESASRAERELLGATRERAVRRRTPGFERRGARGDFVPLHELYGHAGPVRAVAFSPDGRFLASGGSDGTVRGWDVASGGSVGTLEGHAGQVRSVAFSPDGRYLASGGLDGRVRAWTLPNGEPLYDLGGSGWVFCVGFDDESRTLACGDAWGNVRLWDLETGEHLRDLPTHGHWTLCLGFGDAGRLLVSGGADGTVKVRDLRAGDEVVRSLDLPSPVRCVALSGNGRSLVSGCEDGRVRVFEPEREAPVRTFVAHAGPLLCAAVDEGTRTVATAGADGRVKLLDLGTGEPLGVLQESPGAVNTLALSGRLLASGDEVGVVRISREAAEKTTGEPGRSGAGPPPDLPD